MSTTEREDQPPRTEAERAAHYDAHRAEVQAWPEVPPPPGTTVPKQRGVVMSVRFTTDEAAAIERAAGARDLTVSAFLRTVAQQAAGAAPPPVNTSRIADRLIAIADELRPGSKSRRTYAASASQRNTKAAATSSKVLRDGRKAKAAKTAAASALNQRTKKKSR